MSHSNDAGDKFSDYETRKQEVDSVENALSSDWESSFLRLEKYMTNPSEELRRELYALLWRIGTKTSELSRRQAIVEMMMSRILDEGEFLRGQLLRWLQDFDEGDFNDESMKMLEDLPWLDGEAPAVIRLIGIAEAKSKIPALEEMAEHEISDTNGGRWYATKEWAALLALARMVDGERTQRVILRVRHESDIVTRATILFKDLAYTKRPAAFDVLRSYLNSDKRLPAVKHTVPGRPEAIYAAAMFARYFEQFPIDESDLRDSDVSRAREWADRQKEWKIK